MRINQTEKLAAYLSCDTSAVVYWQDSVSAILGRFWECNLLLPLPVTQRFRNCGSSLVAMRMVASGIDGSKAGIW